MNLTSKYFYKSHQKEIIKYIKNDSEYVNIVNFNSNIPDQMFKNIIKLQEGQTVNGFYPKALKIDCLKLYFSP